MHALGPWQSSSSWQEHVVELSSHLERKTAQKREGKDRIDSYCPLQGHAPSDIRSSLTRLELHSAFTNVMVKAMLSTLGLLEHDPNYRNT